MTTAVDVIRNAARLEPPPADANLDLAAAAAAPPPDFQAEQYRVLAHIVEQLAETGRGVIAVSSPIGGDGKTTVSINLARALCHGPESRVLLVDADLRRGRIAEQLGLAGKASPGFAGAIADPERRLGSLVESVPSQSLAVLPAGACPATPYEALRSPRVGELLREARAGYACVLVDTPPVVPVADVRALSQWVDGFVLVVTAHYTPRELVEEALTAMEPEKVVGIVFNGDDLPLSRRYRSYYGYAEPAPRRGLRASLRHAWQRLSPAGRRTCL